MLFGGSTTIFWWFKSFTLGTFDYGFRVTWLHDLLKKMHLIAKEWYLFCLSFNMGVDEILQIQSQSSLFKFGIFKRLIILGLVNSEARFFKNPHLWHNFSLFGAMILFKSIMELIIIMSSRFKTKVANVMSFLRKCKNRTVYPICQLYL